MLNKHRLPVYSVTVKAQYSWLLFDADHTILDFDAAEAHALETVCRELAGEWDDSWAVLYHTINRELWADLEKGVISSAKLRVERFARFQRNANISGDPNTYSARYLELLQEGNFVIDGSRELLERIAPDFKMAVITNGIRDTQLRRFEVTGLGKYFEHIVISEDAGAPKPHAQFFDYALNRIGFFERRDILVIGDSLSSDIAGANSAGIPACWFNPWGIDSGDVAVPDYQISSLDELPGLLYR